MSTCVLFYRSNPVNYTVRRSTSDPQVTYNVTVTNIGDIPGATSVLAYVTYYVSIMICMILILIDSESLYHWYWLILIVILILFSQKTGAPKKELFGFEKVFLNPREKTEITFIADSKAFSSVDTTVSLWWLTLLYEMRYWSMKNQPLVLILCILNDSVVMK